MIIGNFTYDKKQDVYQGEIKTLTFRHGTVHFCPTESKSEKGPHYRVVTYTDYGPVELGAAWKRTSQAKREFLSVTLDDPALSRPLNTALMPSDDDSEAILIWSRPTKRKATAE